MAEKTIVDDLADFEKRAVKLVKDFTIQTEFIAKDKFAPRGATKSLREGIRARKPIIENGVVIGVITSSAENAGFDYAEKQHDRELFHAVAEGQDHLLSFADLGGSGTTQQRYRQGYAKEVSAGKNTGQRVYASKYLDRALAEIEPHFDAAIEAEL